MNTEMNREVDVAALMRPFEGTQVRQRTGPGRKTMDYISGPDVIRRLLDATGNQFAWNVERVQLVTQETSNGLVSLWVVQGTLAVGGLGSRSGVGTHPADSVEAAKAAETDALKRAALKFGVGLHLYEEDGGQNSPPLSSPPHGTRNGTYARPAQAPQPASPRNGNGYGTGNGNGSNGSYAGARRAAPTPPDRFPPSSGDGVGDNAPF